MSTRVHQTWDLGDGELTLDISHTKPFPSEAWFVLADLQAVLAKAAAQLRQAVKAADE